MADPETPESDRQTPRQALIEMWTEEEVAAFCPWDTFDDAERARFRSERLGEWKRTGDDMTDSVGHYITVVPAAVAPLGEAAVSSTAHGFDGRPFFATYPTDDTAQEVAHAMAAVLHGLGVVTVISGCDCAGEHNHRETT